MCGAAAGLGLAAAEAQFGIAHETMQIGLLAVSVAALIVGGWAMWRFWRTVANEDELE